MKNAETKKNFNTYAIVILVSLAVIFGGNALVKTAVPASETEDYREATVMTVKSLVSDQDKGNGYPGEKPSETIYFDAKITDGPSKGQVLQVQQYVDYAYSIPVKPVKTGDKIVICLAPSQSDGANVWQFAEYNRMGKLLVLCGAFLLLIIIIGGFKGVLTILSLVFTLGAIFLVYIPSILKGVNIYLSTILVCLFIIVMCLLLLNGPSKKSLCAILGNLGGVAIAGILGLLMNHVLSITGNVQEEYLLLLNLDQPVDLPGLVWGAMLIGALGAVMDVAMSIASAMHELSIHMEKPSFYKLLKSGMNIGKDAIGTMTNTLILAYIGSSMAMVILLMAYHANLLYFLNLEMVAVELLQGILGSMGILLAVPSTALVSAYFYTRS